MADIGRQRHLPLNQLTHRSGGSAPTVPLTQTFAAGEDEAGRQADEQEEAAMATYIPEKRLDMMACKGGHDEAVGRANEAQPKPRERGQTCPSRDLRRDARLAGACCRGTEDENGEARSSACL